MYETVIISPGIAGAPSPEAFLMVGRPPGDHRLRSQKHIFLEPKCSFAWGRYYTLHVRPTMYLLCDQHNFQSTRQSTGDTDGCCWISSARSTHHIECKMREIAYTFTRSKSDCRYYMSYARAREYKRSLEDADREGKLSCPSRKV